MRTAVRRGVAALGGAGLLLLVGGVGYKTARQRRLAKFYRCFRMELAKAVGDYAGSLRAVAGLTLDVDPGNARKVVVDRPTIDVPNDAELHCFVTATVEADNLGRLVVTIDGPSEVVTYLRDALEADRTITTETPLLVHEGDDAATKIFVRVFAYTDPVVAEVSRLLAKTAS